MHSSIPRPESPRLDLFGAAARRLLRAGSDFPVLALGSSWRFLISMLLSWRRGRGEDIFSSSPLPSRSCHKVATVSSSGLIISSFFTCETPGAAHAAISACSRSAHELTVPRRTIFPSLASTEIVSASSSA